MCLKRSLPMRAAGRAMFTFIWKMHGTNPTDEVRKLLGIWDQQESKFHNTLRDQAFKKKRKRDNIRKLKARGAK